MALTKEEKLVSEGIKNALTDNALGLQDDIQNREDSHAFTNLHEEIEQQFRLEVLNLNHSDAIAATFNRIHSYRYLDDPKFAIGFMKDMKAQGIPLDECNKALTAIGKVRDKLLNDNNEKDAGWHPDLDEIIKLSQPQQIKESRAFGITDDEFSEEREFYKNQKVRKWLNENKNHEFWTFIQARVYPLLENAGHIIKTQKDFWDAYDHPNSDIMIRNRMHELYNSLHAEWLTNV